MRALRAAGGAAAGLLGVLLLPAGASAHAEGAVLPHDLWSSWSLEPLVLLGLAVSASVYARGVARLWGRAGTGAGVRRWQVACFAAGLGALFVALVSPLDPLGETLFSAHMVQHELLMWVAAPLLALAAPLPALLWGLPRGWRAPLGRLARHPGVAGPWSFLTRPATAWILHAAALWLWHQPALYQASVTSDPVHALQHGSFLATALLFWWVLVHRGRGGRVAYGVGVLYVFTTAVHESLLGVLFTFADVVWYPVYDAGAMAAWGLTPLEDQQLAGLVMWIPGGLIYLGAALALFAAWLRALGRERRRAAGVRESGDAPPEPDGVGGRQGAAPSARSAGIAGLLVLALQGCSGVQSVLDPASAEARYVAWLWWGMLAAASLLWGVLVAVLGWGIGRGRGDAPGEDEHRRRAVRWTAVGTGVTAVVLLGVFGASLWIGRGERGAAEAAERTVEVVGHQYWWEVRYVRSEGDTVVSANELHLPVGSPTRLLVRSADVIHSFWVPALGGKIDMIPGKTNRVLVRPEETGRFRGQCAEFCGVQHALMALPVRVHRPDSFAAWLERTARPAAPPRDSLAARGLEVLTGSECVGCHTVRGTAARGVTGPDLTHLASRETLAAGTLENTEANLTTWLADPQAVKPGNPMPATPLTGEELRALVHYLEGLR